MDPNTLISKIMARDLITFRPDEDIWEVMQRMVKNKISGGPVINERGELIGMLSEADCIRVILEDHGDQPGGNGTVADYMSHDVTTVEANNTLVEVASYFTHKNFRRFPVCDSGRLVGQISRSDVLKAVSQLKHKIHLVPDSWKHRMPVESPSKRGYYSENA